MMKNGVGTRDTQFNISMTDYLPTRGPDLHVIIIVGLILVILVAVAAVLLFKYVSRLAHNWRQRRAEEVMARAINIYNSQEPLEEPDLVYLRPGDHGIFQPAKSHRGDSEIAFVHSDGRIERFRPLIGTNNSTRELPLARIHHNYKTELRQNSRDAKYHSNDKEAYTDFQPLCVKLDTVPTLCLGADVRDNISLAGCDIPPSYEEALDMPLATNIISASKSQRDFAMERQSDYCNIEIGQQHNQSNT